LSEPDSLAGHTQPIITLYDFEAFLSVQCDAYEKKNGREPFFEYPEGFVYSEENYPELDFYWQTENRADMRKVCPKLYDAMLKKPQYVHPPKRSPKR